MSKETSAVLARTPRLLLACSSFLSAAGGALHAAAFGKALPAISASNLPRVYEGSSKALWLADSAVLFIVAAVFGLIAIRPSTATRPVVLLVALIPAATAALIYTFLGNFFAGHVLVAIAALALFAGLQFPGAAAGRTHQ
jgi:hypothetical protein